MEGEELGEQTGMATSRWVKATEVEVMVVERMAS